MIDRTGILVLCALAFASSAFAVSPRVFVASSGSDTGSCSRSAPCRNFAYAVQQVDAGGELVALDTAGYGPIVIGKSISLYAAPGAVASITATTGADIAINAGLNDSIAIRGLLLNSSGSTYGIDFVGGGTLQVDHCVFTGFSSSVGAAVNIARGSGADTARATLDHIQIQNSFTGVNTSHGASGRIALAIRDAVIDNIANAAVRAGDNTFGVVTDSVITAAGTGIDTNATTNSDFTILTLERCTFAFNATAISSGHAADLGLTYVRLANCIISENTYGVIQQTNGTVQSKTSNGTFTNTLNNTYGNVIESSYQAQ
jgi:hypothetical protein